MARCPNCGKQSSEEARFCRACGSRLAGAGKPDAYTPNRLSSEERSRRLLEDAFRLSEQGKLQPAIQACQQAIALNPTSTSAHSLLGTLYERVGDRDGAIREYEQVLTLSPGSTVERRRLNELMGVPAAAAPAPVSARTAQVALTGAFMVVVLVLLTAIVLTPRRGGPPAREERPGAPARVARQTVATVRTSAAVAPSRLRRLGWSSAPRPPAPRRVAERPAPAATRRPAGSFGQWLGPGTYMLPAGGRERFVGLASTPPAVGPRYTSAPLEGAVRVRAGTVPTLRSPQAPQGPAFRELGGPRDGQERARSYYFAGDYQGAIDSYQAYVVQHPTVAAPREELAWVYVETGDYQNARQQYQIALDQNRDDIKRGHNIEAAKHGTRTCESAISALETE